MTTKDTITLDTLLDEIEQIRELALNENDYKTALSCTLSKAKLLGGGGMIERRQQQRENPSPFDKLMSLTM
jgi:hypothetical protein